MNTKQHDDKKIIVDLLYKKHGKMFLDKVTTSKELDIGRATLDRMREAGEIKSSTIRGSVKFSLTEIANFTI